MRKHRTFKQEPTEQKEKKSKMGVYISIFLAVIMVGGIAGIFISNPSGSDYSYGKHDFKNVNNLWITKINKIEKTFYYVPDQISNFKVSNQSIDILKNSQGVIITFDPTINSSSKLQAIDIFRFELANTLVETNAQRQIGFAVSKPSNLSKFPLITCQNTSLYLPVLLLEFSNETKIDLINNCVVLQSTDEYSLLASLDYLRYKLYGIL